MFRPSFPINKPTRSWLHKAKQDFLEHSINCITTLACATYIKQIINVINENISVQLFKEKKHLQTSIPIFYQNF